MHDTKRAETSDGNHRFVHIIRPTATDNAKRQGSPSDVQQFARHA
jgi:hypothetical protein